LVSKAYNSRDKTKSATFQKLQEALLDANPESALLRKIKDILDDLFVMTLIKTQEETFARTFVKNLQHRITPDRNGIEKPEQMFDISSIQFGREKLNISLAKLNDVHAMEDAGYTMSAARAFLDDLQDQLMELQALKNAAENTMSALKDLLTLKQQHVFSAKFY